MSRCVRVPSSGKWRLTSCVSPQYRKRRAGAERRENKREGLTACPKRLRRRERRHVRDLQSES
ncbi:hypothetical protein OH77DRAFT_1421742, partial [Trametes cingulata]